MKRPAFQFYPKDWRADVALQSCSLTARGLWLELCLLMHECEPYGHLTKATGHALPDESAARLVRIELRDYRRLLAELEAAGVSSRLPDGVLYSRRMVRDEVERQNWRKWQRSHRDKGETTAGRPPDNGPDIVGNVRQKSGRTASSSASSSSKDRGVASQPVGQEPDDEPFFDVHGNRKIPKPEERRLYALGREARAVLAFLNDKAGKRFPDTDTNVGIIVARLRQGFTPAQLRQVVAFKVRAWKDDPDCREWLRPATLFGRAKFSNYVGELVPDAEGSSAEPAQGGGAP